MMWLDNRAKCDIVMIAVVAIAALSVFLPVIIVAHYFPSTYCFKVEARK